MLKFFRFISLLEGFSYLAILCVTFGLISREFVSPLGMGHGVLFMVYIVACLLAASTQRWSLKVWLPILLASLLPLAFILVELYLRKTTKAALEKTPI